jgi:hypothetical protein
MAWKNGYYYRSHWHNGTCQTEYVGSGYAAEFLAEQDANERLQRQIARERFRRLVAERTAIDNEINAVGDALADLVDAALLVNGYRQHKRQWRKQSERNDDNRTNTNAATSEIVA